MKIATAAATNNITIIIIIIANQFFIVYGPSQQLQGQLSTQHSVDTDIYTKINESMYVN
jgi:hypothetical protein